MNLIERLRKRFDGTKYLRLALTFISVAILLPAIPSGRSAAQDSAAVYEGFGAHTRGGEGQPFYYVSNLNDGGPGSLRDALSQGNRHIVFAVAGEILLGSRISVRGANITVDGFTAPAPGITLKSHGLGISGSGTHDIIVRGIRVHLIGDVPEQEDGISIVSGAYNVVVDHVSIRGASDESIGINNAHDVTISWSILADPLDSHNTNLLITNGARRLSIHHNIFVESRRRNPWMHYSDVNEAPEIQADVRNNLMWNVSGTGTNHGTVVFAGSKANIVDNYYKASAKLDAAAQKRAIVICKKSGMAPEDTFCQNRMQFPPARAYVAGNISLDGWSDSINAKGTEAEPFAAPPVKTTDACNAAHDVLANAGVTPRDSADQQYLSAISLPPCAEVAATLQVNPVALDFSATVGAANPAAKKLTLTTSAGNGSWNVARPNVNWLSVSPGSGTAPSQLSVNVQSSGLPAGVHYASISVAAADTSNSPIVVPITLTVEPGAAEPSNPPQITAPAAGSTLSGSTVTFSWSANGKNVKNWRLLIGSAKGAKDLYDSKVVGTTRLSRTVRNVPTDGRPIWVQLQFKIDGTWQSADYQYQAASQ